FTVRLTTTGLRKTLVVPWSPPASVAVRTNSRFDGYSWSGATNEPLATPVKEVTVWMWSFGGVPWWISKVQVRPEAGRVPCSASVAWPEKGMVWPTVQVRDDGGVSMTGTGAVLLTVMTTEAVSDAPPLSVTRRRAV